MKYQLPVDYTQLTPYHRKKVREQYIEEQDGLCMYCGESLQGKPAKSVRGKKINLRLFPPNFLKHPVHLQHNHNSGMTEGAVHAYCNAVMWQYERR